MAYGQGYLCFKTYHFMKESQRIIVWGSVPGWVLILASIVCLIVEIASSSMSFHRKSILSRGVMACLSLGCVSQRVLPVLAHYVYLLSNIVQEAKVRLSGGTIQGAEPSKTLWSLFRLDCGALFLTMIVTLMVWVLPDDVGSTECFVSTDIRA
jgi:hypothetical protein